MHATSSAIGFFPVGTDEVSRSAPAPQCHEPSMSLVTDIFEFLPVFALRVKVHLHSAIIEMRGVFARIWFPCAGSDAVPLRAVALRPSLSVSDTIPEIGEIVSVGASRWQCFELR